MQTISRKITIDRKTLYEITALGQQILAQEIARIEEMYRLITQSKEEKG